MKQTAGAGVVNEAREMPNPNHAEKNPLFRLEGLSERDVWDESVPLARLNVAQHISDFIFSITGVNICQFAYR